MEKRKYPKEAVFYKTRNSIFLFKLYDINKIVLYRNDCIDIDDDDLAITTILNSVHFRRDFVHK